MEEGGDILVSATGLAAGAGQAPGEGPVQLWLFLNARVTTENLGLLDTLCWNFLKNFAYNFFYFFLFEFNIILNSSQCSFLSLQNRQHTEVHSIVNLV